MKTMKLIFRRFETFVVRRTRQLGGYLPSQESERTVKPWDWSYDHTFTCRLFGKWLMSFRYWFRPYLNRIQFDVETRWYTVSVQLDCRSGLSLLGYPGGEEPAATPPKEKWTGVLLTNGGAE